MTSITEDALKKEQILLLYKEGLSSIEIADKLGISSESEVRSIIFRSLLRKAVKNV